VTGEQVIDLGHGHTLTLCRWPDIVVPAGGEPFHAADVDHPTPDGRPCSGHVTLDVPAMREMWPDVPRWTVESWEPLTLSPSLLCWCGDHGFVREGRWVPA